MKKAFFNYLIAHNYFMNKTNMDQETNDCHENVLFVSSRRQTEQIREGEHRPNNRDSREEKKWTKVGGEISFLMIAVKWHERIWANIIILKLFSSLLSNNTIRVEFEKNVYYKNLLYDINNNFAVICWHFCVCATSRVSFPETFSHFRV